jgi:hypothetical protein
MLQEAVLLNLMWYLCFIIEVTRKAWWCLEEMRYSCWVGVCVDEFEMKHGR